MGRMINELLGPAVDFLAADIVPVWVFLVALLTQAAYWSNMIKKRVAPVLDRYLPVGGGDNGKAP